mmetsp:Transcript_13336/g.33936  ORF Transcript_13336/g.33936 Transcript_13336/m.33936 type:complete len:248 (+) Transcript_13336:225-968(+)
MRGSVPPARHAAGDDVRLELGPQRRGGDGGRASGPRHRVRAHGGLGLYAGHRLLPGPRGPRGRARRGRSPSLGRDRGAQRAGQYHERAAPHASLFRRSSRRGRGLQRAARSDRLCVRGRERSAPILACNQCRQRPRQVPCDPARHTRLRHRRARGARHLGERAFVRSVHSWRGLRERCRAANLHAARLFLRRRRGRVQVRDGEFARLLPRHALAHRVACAAAHRRRRCVRAALADRARGAVQLLRDA